jgi:hypothetical protein
MENTISDIRIGARITFEGKVITDTTATSSADPSSPTQEPTSRPSSPFVLGTRRNNPLATPLSPFSPPDSPVTYFQNFNLSNASTEDASAILLPPAEERTSRFSDARRRASVYQTRVYTTASKIWTRATARGKGSITFVAVIQDIELILPHQHLPPTSLTTQSSAADLKQSFNADSYSHSQSFGSIQSFLRPKRPRYALPACGGGYDRLLVIEGESRLRLGLGFGPKKGLLGEDTLEAGVDIGKVWSSLGALDRVMELMKRNKGTENGEAKEKKRSWKPRSIQRVSHISPSYELRDPPGIETLRIVLHVIHHLPPLLLISTAIHPCTTSWLHPSQFCSPCHGRTAYTLCALSRVLILTSCARSSYEPSKPLLCRCRRSPSIIIYPPPPPSLFLLPPPSQTCPISQSKPMTTSPSH